MKIFDAHADIWNDVVVKRNKGEKHILKKYHLDKFQKGEVFSGILVVWVDRFYKQAKRFKEIVQAMSDELEENADLLHIVKSYNDFQFANEKGMFPVVLGIEGFDGLDGDLSLLDKLYKMGFRHGSLTWNTENAFATGVKGNPDRGLTSLGVSAVKEMKNLNMLIDVSHANEKTFWDILDTTDSTIIASHSNCKALCNVPRNLTDQQIKAIAERDGVIGIVAYHEFISRNQSEYNLKAYCNHIDHIVDLVGIDYVGLGFDFVDYVNDDAMKTFSNDADTTVNLEDASCAHNVVTELFSRGYSLEDVDKVCSKNFMRVIKKVIS